MSALNAAPPFAGLTAGDVLSPGVLSCAAETPLPAVAAMMVVHQIHAVVVPGAAGREPAMVGHIDVIAHAAGRGRPAGDLAGTVPAVTRDHPLASVVRTMARYDATHVVVVDDGRAPIGVLSTLDAIAVLAGRRARSVRAPRPLPARPAVSTSRLEAHVVSDVMHDGVFWCEPGAELRLVAAAMTDHRTHALAVAGDPPSGWRTISDLDLLRAVSNATGAKAGEIATDRSGWVAPDEPLDRVAARMVREGRTHLFVGADRPVGVISTSNLLGVIAIGAAEMREEQ